MRLSIYLILLFLLLQPTFSQEFQTSNSVSPIRNQEVFEVGGRVQRVRLFFSNSDSTYSALFASDQFTIITNDPAVSSKSFNTYYGTITQSPKQLGMSIFAENSDAYGLVINFPLVSCAVKAIELIKSIGDTREKEFNIFRIDEINIFLKPVLLVTGGDYKLSISPVAAKPIDPALNIQIPILMPEGKCMLPNKDKLEAAFKNAVCIGEQRMSYCKRP